MITQKINKLLLPLLYCTLFFLISACTKNAGEGGNAILEGKILVKEYDQYNQLIKEYPATDKKVFICYGSDTISLPDNDTNTDQTGNYQFKYLFKGNYTIYAYSDCYQCPSNEEAIGETIVVENNKNQSLTVPTITITKGGGNQAIIRGKLKVQNYNQAGQFIAEYYGADLRVYLISHAQTDSIYDDDTRTNFDGSYEFNNLKPGKYSIFAYSKCTACPSQQDSKMVAVSIPENHTQTIFTAPELVVKD